MILGSKHIGAILNVLI